MKVKEKQEVVALNARVNRHVCRAFDIEVAKLRISKQEAVEEALRLWLSAQAKQSEGLPIRAPILPSAGRDQYVLSAQDIDDALLS